MIAMYLCLSAVLPPCPASLPFTVTADVTVPLYWRAEAIKSVVRWNKVLDRRVFIWLPSEPADIVITVKKELDSPTFIGYARSNGDVCNYTGTIELLERLACRGRVRRVIVHELGHMLGLKHEDAPNNQSVMHQPTKACGEEMNDKISPELRKRALEIVNKTIIRRSRP